MPLTRLRNKSNGCSVDDRCRRAHDRAARIVGRLIGRRTVAVSDSVCAPGDAVGVRIITLGSGSPRAAFRPDSAIIPLAPRANPAEATAGLALSIEASRPLSWTRGQKVAARAIASALATEIKAARELDEYRLAAEELHRDATHDRVTGAWNRASVIDRITVAAERTRRHRHYRFAVLCVDIGGFGALNEALGLDAADDVLREVSARLLRCVRAEDIVARIGGGQFAMLAEPIKEPADGGRIALRILDALAAPVQTPDGEMFVAANVGVALGTSDVVHGHQPATRLIQRATIAMSRARSQGPTQYEIFDRQLHERASARLRAESDLRRAIGRDEFEVYYQPLISLETGAITEVEALLRWRHPDRGMVLPSDFIPLAEATDLILPLGDFVLSESSRTVRRWKESLGDDSPLTLSVNLSVRQLRQADFVRRVCDTVRNSGIHPSAVRFEITENFAINEPKAVARRLDELRALGHRIYLDDFGTGYSSLGYLHWLPVDGIKIDRTFVAQMNAGPREHRLVALIHDIATNIGAVTVAEGVETESQAATLRTLGCQYAQGYLFSRPIPEADMEALVRRSAAAHLQPA